MGRPRIAPAVGTRFSHLTVIEDLGVRDGRSFVRVRCDCGNEREAFSASLRRKEVTQCSLCKARESGNTRRQGVNGPAYWRNRGLEYIYSAFNGARSRCENRKNEAYANYGERGIRFRFDSPMHIWETIRPRPTEEHSLYRIDVDGHYEAGNVRWANKLTQAANTRTHADKLTSKYRGVVRRPSGKWRSRIRIARKLINLGSYDSEIEAAKAFDLYIIENHLPHNINFPENRVCLPPPPDASELGEHTSSSWLYFDGLPNPEPLANRLPS